MIKIRELYDILGRSCKYATLFLMLFFNYTCLNAQSNTLQDSQYAKLLIKQAQTLFDEAKYDSSLKYASEAVAYFSSNDNWTQLAKNYNLLSSNYRVLSKLDSATTYARKSLQILSNQNLEMPLLQIKALNNQGLIEVEKSNFDRAIARYNQALDLSDHPSVPVYIKAMLLGNIGSAYDDRGSFDKAIDYYSKGVGLLDSEGSNEHRRQLAKLYNYLGVTYGNKGLFDQARQFYERELEMNINLYGESHPSVAGGYNNIGGIYYRNGDIGEAIVYFKRAASSTEVTFGKSHPRVALIYNNIGACYYEIGNYALSVDYLKKSAAIKKETQGANHPDLALTYNNIGGIYIEMGNYEEAIDNLQRSLHIRREALGKEHPILSNNYNSLGLLYLKTDRPDTAIQHFNKGLAITEKARGSKHPFAAEARTNLAKAYRTKDDFTTALDILKEAEMNLSRDANASSKSSGSFILNSDFHYPIYAADVLHQKGKTFYMQYKATKQTELLESALAVYKNLSNLLDAIQLSFQNEESKLLMGSRSHKIYEEAIQISYDLHKETDRESYLNDIFFFSEKSKSRVILELLNSKQAKKYAGIPDSLLSHERNLRNKLSNVQQSLSSNIENTSINNEKDSLRASLFTLNRSLNNHLERLRKDYPKYYSFKFRSEVPSLSKLKNTLSEKGATLLEYFYGEESTWAMVVNADVTKVIPLPHIPQLPDKIGTFNKSIAQKRDSTYFRLGKALYRDLVEPVEQFLVSGSLLIVPDGALNLLPFDALLTEKAGSEMPYAKLPYLLNRYAINYKPSVSLSSYLDDWDKASYSKKFIGYAPEFSDISLENYLNFSDRNNWEPLPASRYEVQEIAKSVNEDKSFWATLSGKNAAKVLVGARATEAHFKNGSMNQYRYLHLATHAFASDSSKGRAGIAFYPDEKSGEDGILYSEEIYGLNLSNELVVLSACETGTGEVRSGEGIIGLRRAFQYAGAENLLVSLWNVEDRSTARLMISFYENLLKGSSTAGALQTAKKSLIQNSAYAHPRYWSPFIFIGN